MADDRMPVVLIHGALRSRVGLVPTMAYLSQRGFDARPFGYNTRSESLNAHGERLEAFIIKWLGTAQPTPILGILTHSMGGLVARSYLARPSVAEHSTRQRLAMMAPPNQGAQLARKNKDWALFHWAYGKAADELHPDRVAALPLPPKSCEVLVMAGGTGKPTGINPSIDGDDDGLVAVSETRLPGVEPVFVGGIHSLMQWRPDVLDRAIQFFQAGVVD
ncbi:MAG: hypothetical protein AAFV53_35525, partial [Myxococcota bacterium]